MTAEQPNIVSRLPSWIASYLNYGLSGIDNEKKRSQLICNWIMGLSALSGAAHAFGFLMLGPAYWPASIVAVLIALGFASGPILFKALPSIMIIFGTVLLNGLMSLQTFLLGTDSGTHIYMFLTPTIWLAILGSRRPKHLAFVTASAIVFMLTCMIFFDIPALDLPFYETFAVTSLIGVVSWTTVLILAVGYLGFNRAEAAEEALAAEHARSEALLYNLLPEDIAARLKVEPDQTIADSLPKVAILFADIVDFTPRASKLPPEEVVGFLNKIFRAFDELAEKHGLEKIKTIGDAYMVAAGMPNPCGDPVHRVAEMALDMQRSVEKMSPEFPDGLEVRIGLHAGPAVAGVIGNRKLFYDVWGETVNTASRMESHGEPGRIQVTTAAKEELEDAYEFEPRGTIEVKGIGAVETCWLAGAQA